MAISAATIIKKVRDLIGDQDDTRHPDAELLEYLNEAQRAAVLIRPEVNPVTAILTTEYPSLAARNALDEYNIIWGAQDGQRSLRPGTRQIIPDGGYVFISAIRNLERMTDVDEHGDPVDMTSRLIPKRAATPTDQENLDQADKNWHIEIKVTDGNLEITATEVSPGNTMYKAENSVENFVYDIRNRSVFYNYPYIMEFNPGTLNDEEDPYIPHCYLEIIYATVPEDANLDIKDADGMITTPDSGLRIDDVYEPALVNYMLHRACGKDPASAEDVQKSTGYLANFTTLITGNADQKELELVVRHSPAEGARGG